MTTEVQFGLGVLAIAVSAGGPVALFAFWMYRQPPDARSRALKWEHHRSRSAKLVLLMIASVACMILLSWGLSAVTGAL